MSVLTDTSLSGGPIGTLNPVKGILFTKSKQEWENNPKAHDHNLLIEPFRQADVTPIGYDLRVGAHYIRVGRRVQRLALSEGDIIKIKPRQLVIIESLEYVGMPQDKSISGLFVSKVSLVSRGLSPVSTSLDSDWRGHLLIALTNTSKRPVRIAYGDSLCTMMLLKNAHPSTMKCGRTDAGHFQNLLDKLQSEQKPWRDLGLALLWRLAVASLPLVFAWTFAVSKASITVEGWALAVALSSLVYGVLSTLFPLE